MSKNEDFTDYRQICFKLEMEIKDRQKELVEAMKRYVPTEIVADVEYALAKARGETNHD